MKRLSFASAATPLDLAAAAAIAGARLDGEAEAAWLVRAVAPLDRAERDEVTAFFDGLPLDDLLGTHAGACLVSLRHLEHVPPTTTALLTDEPRAAMVRLAAVLHPAGPRSAVRLEAAGFGPAAWIAASARFESDVTVDPGAIVGDDAEIGSGTVLGANCVIGAGVRIGRGCAIGAGAVLYHALVGDRVIIRSGARLGEDDSVSPPTEPSLGRVIVQNDVVVGTNAVVARGRLADTVIGEGARLAALVAVPAGAVVARGAAVAR